MFVNIMNKLNLTYLFKKNDFYRYENNYMENDIAFQENIF